MTEKELRKLNRYQLLDLLLVQTQRTERLQKEMDAAQEQLKHQQISLSALGSIAEASLQLSGVFEAAQKAGDLYIEAAKKRAEEIEQEAHQKAASIIKNAEDEACYISIIKQGGLEH